MKRLIIATFAMALTFSVATSADAIPRIQTYISGADYQHNFGGWDDTWMSGSNNFNLKVVGGWNNAARQDWMETYLVVGVLRGETGSVSVNGVELTTFDNVRPDGLNLSNNHFSGSPRGRMDLRYYHLGKLDNSTRNATYYRTNGRFGGSYYGDEFNLGVRIDGFSYAHFNAAGTNRMGHSYRNKYKHDSTFNRRDQDGGGGDNEHPVPEPGTLALLGTGLLGLIPVLRRRKS